MNTRVMVATKFRSIEKFDIRQFVIRRAKHTENLKKLQRSGN